jgi:hypothetical protein
MPDAAVGTAGDAEGAFDAGGRRCLVVRRAAHVERRHPQTVSPQSRLEAVELGGVR